MRRELVAAAEPDIELALRMAVLRAAGVPRSEFPARLDRTPADLRPAWRLLKAATERLAGDHDTVPAPEENASLETG